MFEKIMVPLDGSVLAEAALPFAEELAGRLSADLVLLYVSDPAHDPYRHMYDPYLEKMVETVKGGVRNFQTGIVAKEPHVESQILVGAAAEQIRIYSETKDISLIVISSHGHTGFKRWTLGNVADKVIRNATRPVAVIRAKGTNPSKISKMLVTLDGSKVSESALAYTGELATRLKVELIVFEVLTPDYYAYTSGASQELDTIKKTARDYLDKIATQMQQKGITVKTLLQEGLVTDTAEIVINKVAETGADMAIMSTHGRSGISRWALGSLADKVLRGIDTPLILVKPPETVKQ